MLLSLCLPERRSTSSLVDVPDLLDRRSQLLVLPDYPQPHLLVALPLLDQDDLQQVGIGRVADVVEQSSQLQKPPLAAVQPQVPRVLLRKGHATERVVEPRVPGGRVDVVRKGKLLDPPEPLERVGV
jgi:hypothetical protein